MRDAPPIAVRAALLTSHSTMAAAAPPPAARRIALLKGHTDGLTALAVATPERASGEAAAACLLASGAEDGGVCVHSLATQQLLCKVQLSPGSDSSSEQAGVGALAFAAARASGSSGDAGEPQQWVLFAGVGAELAMLLLTHTAAAGAGEVAGSGEAPTTTTAAVDEALPGWRLQVLQRQAVSDDDISSLAVNSQGTFLAAADDAGDVCLFDISALQQQLVQQQPLQQQQQQQPSLQPLRTIAGAHDPMACAVAFRGPPKPWQLLSGGVDNRVALWDFSRPKKCCGSWNMAHMAGQHPQVQGVSAAAGADEQQQQHQQQHQQQGQLWNPPFVHALALPPTAAEGRGGPASSGHAPPVPPAVVRRLVAVARGDGVVSVFDADPDDKPVKASSSSSSSSKRTGAAAAAAAVSSQHRAASKGNKAASKSKAAASTPPPAAAGAPQDPQQQPEQQRQPEQQQQPQALAEVPPGFHVCLDSRFGGHTLAAASVAFMPCGHRLLWSGGQDGRLLLWDWAAAFSGGGGGAAGPGPLVLDVAHKRKVNALACCWEPGGGAAAAQSGEHRPAWLLVAGTGRNVNVYRVVAGGVSS